MNTEGMCEHTRWGGNPEGRGLACHTSLRGVYFATRWGVLRCDDTRQRDLPRYVDIRQITHREALEWGVQTIELRRVDITRYPPQHERKVYAKVP